MEELPPAEWTWNSQRWPLLILSLECMSKTGVEPIAITREKLVLVKWIKWCGNRSENCKSNFFEDFCLPNARRCIAFQLAVSLASDQLKRHQRWVGKMRRSSQKEWLSRFVGHQSTYQSMIPLPKQWKKETNTEMLNWHYCWAPRWMARRERLLLTVSRGVGSCLNGVSSVLVTYILI